MTKPLKLDDLVSAADASLQDEDWLVLDSAIENAVRAILTTIKEAGWTIVPVEADENMIQARIDAYPSELRVRDYDTQVWRSMIAAAPVIEGE